MYFLRSNLDNILEKIGQISTTFISTTLTNPMCNESLDALVFVFAKESFRIRFQLFSSKLALSSGGTFRFMALVVSC
jgi:hypothetical protein